MVAWGGGGLKWEAIEIGIIGCALHIFQYCTVGRADFSGCILSQRLIFTKHKRNLFGEREKCKEPVI